MKVSKKQAAQNKERILDVAAKLFRERGFDGISVADLMKSAGLTHGGFYGHFSSKEDLMAQASARALADSRESWEKKAAKAAVPRDALSEIIAAYLSLPHRDNSGEGCLIAALGADVSRQNSVVRHRVTEGVEALVETLIPLMPGDSEATKRTEAIATYASLVGGLVLSRTVDDPLFSEEILKAVSASLVK